MATGSGRFFKIFNDRSEQLNRDLENDANSGLKKGNSTKRDVNGNPYPKGFTPPQDFYINPNNVDPESGFPIEYGNVNTNLYNVRLDKSTPNIRFDLMKEEYAKFDDYSFLFKNIDNKIETPNGDIKRSIPDEDIDNRTIYLGSFVQTIKDKDEPTILGFDVEIDVINSPLFNGEIENFIEKYGQYNSEIRARGEILQKFKEHFFKFFQTNSSIGNNVDVDKIRVYYLKSLKGLNNLVESVESDKTKAFVDYGKDYLTLEVYEDVMQNMGHLSTLYKMLSWSRIGGKYIIPENLLRFDLTISITEIRNFVFLKKDSSNNFNRYKDLISKYVYKLYECQFFFSTLPHTDSLDMSANEFLKPYEFKINYKFTTYKFIKYDGANSIPYIIDNANKNLSNNTRTSIKKDNILSNQNYTVDIFDEVKNTYEEDYVDDTTETDNDIVRNKNSDKFKNAALGLVENLKKAGVNEVNRRIISQARLINDTLENIRNRIPYASRMSERTNVYDENNMLRNDVINSFRTFVGQSLKSLF